jgi:hypothetical protein
VQCAYVAFSTLIVVSTPVRDNDKVFHYGVFSILIVGTFIVFVFAYVRQRPQFSIRNILITTVIVASLCSLYATSGLAITFAAATFLICLLSIYAVIRYFK